jgi:flagellar hook-length control protein FliK
MNIEGVNLLSLLSGNSRVEGGVQSLLENGVIPEDFANALMGQIGLLSEANGLAELPGQLQGMAMPQNMEDLLKNKVDDKELVALFEKYLPTADKKNETAGLNENVGLEVTLLALADTEALKAVMPSIAPDAAATAAQGMIGANGLPFAKPLPDGAKLDKSVEDVPSGDFLQKETALCQSIQDGQGFNLQSLENAGPAKKTLATEKQASLLGLEKAMPGITADILPTHRPIDNRADGPAITKPLTHPGWSNDLGEQILWMHNKAMPGAELRLNPAHLGPISVRIDVNQDQQATIMFTAQHADVKEAIEASIPKLREMLVTQQLNLVSVNISQNSTPDQGRPQPQLFSKMPGDYDQGNEGAAETTKKIEPDEVIVSKGLLSLYA